MKRRTLAVIAMSVLATVAVPLEAKASVRPAGDIDFAVGKETGWGFNGRLGYELDLVFAKIVPEVGGGWTTFSPVPDKEGHDVIRGFAGARLRFGTVIVPSFFAHVGYGRIKTTRALPNDVSAGGLTADAGAALEFTLLPLIDFGLHGGVTVVAPQSSNSSVQPAGTATPPTLGTMLWGFVGAQITLRIP